MVLATKNGRSRPRANNVSIASLELHTNIRKMLIEFGEVPLHVVSMLYLGKFGKFIDLTADGYPGGLPEFLRNMGDMIEMRRDEDGTTFVSVNSRVSPDYNGVCPPKTTEPKSFSEDDKKKVEFQNLIKENRKRRFVGRLFNRDGFLWRNKPWQKYLNKPSIIIDKSAYEMAIELCNKRVVEEVKKIRSLLSCFPKGIRLSDINRYINIDLRIFNVSTSLNSLTMELPEVFYRVEQQEGEPLIFDGFSHTIDLTSQHERLFVGGMSAEKIVATSINIGLYQETLILIKETGVKGLKINVWYRSIEANFHPMDKDEVETGVFKFDAMTFFLALKCFDLIELKSHDQCKNDLRAFLPRKQVEYLDLKSKISDLVPVAASSKSSNSQK